jgi:hypothetical protein
MLVFGPFPFGAALFAISFASQKDAAAIAKPLSLLLSDSSAKADGTLSQLLAQMFNSTLL